MDFHLSTFKISALISKGDASFMQEFDFTTQELLQTICDIKSNGLFFFLHQQSFFIFYEKEIHIWNNNTLRHKISFPFVGLKNVISSFCWDAEADALFVISSFGELHKLTLSAKSYNLEHYGIVFPCLAMNLISSNTLILLGEGCESAIITVLLTIIT